MLQASARAGRRCACGTLTLNMISYHIIVYYIILCYNTVYYVILCDVMLYTQDMERFGEIANTLPLAITRRQFVGTEEFRELVCTAHHCC